MVLASGTEVRGVGRIADQAEVGVDSTLMVRRSSGNRRIGALEIAGDDATVEDHLAASAGNANDGDAAASRRRSRREFGNVAGDGAVLHQGRCH